MSRRFPFSEPNRLDLDPLVAHVRAAEPLCRVQLPHGEPAWLLTRYADARTALGDPRFSRAAALDRDEPRSWHRGPAGGIADLDPPEHTRLRGLAAKAFTTRRVEELRPRARAIADGLVDAMLDRGAPADLVEDFALPLPITVICELLGVPYDDRVDFRDWTDAFVSTSGLTPEQAAERMGRMREYMAGLIARRRETATDDLLGALVTARDEEDRLSEGELLSLAVGLLVAGFETTATQIPNSVYVLLTHPEQLAALRADPGLMPNAVEELMRYVPLFASVVRARYATEDVALTGGTVHAGEPVVVYLAAATRDESVYPDPDRLDLARREAPNIGFGYGPHHCLGAALARMELRVALETLLTRLPGLRFAESEQDVAWKSGTGVHGPRHLPVRW